MSDRRTHEVMVRLSDSELARLDELRLGVTPRAVYLRNLLREPPADRDVADHREALALLSEQARAGKVAAAVALERALRGTPDSLAGKVDDVVDHIEETADFMGLYRIEAPMDQSLAMADVLVKSCEQLAMLLEHLRGFKDLSKYWVEIHRLENDGDRLFREALAALFAGGIDPMVVIRWRDIFLRLERAIDATETAATVVEGLAMKNA